MNMMKGKALIFTGGLGPEAARVRDVIEKAEISIAADSGWDLAADMNVVPDYYIGDMDSVADHAGLKLLPDDRKIIHPVDKDFTDTELAIKFLEDKQYRDIVLIGGGGGRIDHLLAIQALFSREYKPAAWFTAEEHIVYSRNDCIFECGAGRTVSFFNCSEEEAVVSTEGMKWELEKFILNSRRFSLSNITLNDCFRLKIHSGDVLVIINY